MTNLDMMGIRQRVSMYRSTMDNKSTDHKACLSHACEIIDELLAEVERLHTEVELYSRHRVKLQAEVEKWVAYTMVHSFDEIKNCPIFYDYCRCGTPENTQERLEAGRKAEARIRELEKRTHLLDES